jgi:hypothetical protein
MINLQELKTRYPKSFDKLKQYLEKSIRKLLLSLQGVQDERDFPISDELIMQYIEGTLPANPRLLFDFFDLHKIHVIVTLHVDDESIWVSWNTVEKVSSTFNSRFEAELAGFEKAFETLEKQL